MNGNEHLTTGEFERGIARIEERFDKMESRFGDRLDDHGERLAVLETTDRNARRADTRRVAGWSTFIAAIVTGAIEGIRRALGG